MEKFRRANENWWKGKLMSSNDHVRSWQNKKMKGDGAVEDVKRREKEKLEDKNQLINESPRMKKNLDRLKGTKLQKKNAFSLELKSLKKSKTSREPLGFKPEVKRFQKPSDKVGRNDSVVFCWEKKEKPEMRKYSSFSSTWDHTNYFIVPSKNPHANKECALREKKNRKMEKAKKQKNKFAPRAEEKMASPVNHKDGILLPQKKKKPEKFIDISIRGRPIQKKNNSDGQAVIIYQRHKKKNYIDPNFTGGYRFEQISFAGSCETPLDFTQSKRSLSEPRQKSLKEFYIAQRRTRLQLKPDDMFTEHSNFCSTIDFLQNKDVSDELKKIQNKKNLDYLEKEKYLQSQSPKQVVLRKSKSNTEMTVLSEKEKVEKRLKETAVKKLDLHREMLRLEKMDRKKFWESIKQSLNYRCALADMFSSQSFLSQNASAKFFSSTENSTEIFVREGVIEKFSSYQGFHRFGKPKVDGVNNTQKTIDPASGSAYCEMKTMLGSILIKEEDEDIYSRKLKDESSSSGSSQSVVAGADTEKNNLPESASEKFTMMENSLRNSPSELQVLMSKLFNEIKQCSEFITFLQKMEKKKENLGKCAEKEREWRAEKKEEKAISKKSDFSILPVMIFPAMNSFGSAKLTDSLEKVRIKKASEEDLDIDDTSFSGRRIIGKDEVELKRSGKSDSSLKSFPSATLLERASQKLRASEAVEKDEDLAICCDDCQHLKERIVKLEKELERIEKKMPFCPLDYQDSVKICLERLKATSETVLRRLRSCAKLKYDQSCALKCRKKGSKQRSLSAPESISKKDLRRRNAIKPSISDCNLNVGMEITMENVDPITGEKLHPEVSNDTEQEGNIQCKVFKDGEEPLLVIDTDFSYNPQTGMLFKKKLGKSSSHQSVNFSLPTKKKHTTNPTPTLSQEKPWNSKKKLLESYECRFHEDSFNSKGPLLSQKHEEIVEWGKEPQRPQTKAKMLKPQKKISFLNCDEQRCEYLAPVIQYNKKECKKLYGRKSPECKILKDEGRESETEHRKKVKETKGEKQERLKESKSRTSVRNLFRKQEPKPEKSRIPRRRKTTPSGMAEKFPVSSPKSSTASIIKSEESNADRSITSDKVPVQKSSGTTSKKLQRPFSRRKIRVVEKSTQTYEKNPLGKQVKFTAEAETQTNFCITKNNEVQVSMRPRSESVQTCTVTGLPKTCSSDTITLSYRVCSCGDVCKKSQTDFPVNGPVTVSIGIQTIAQKNCFSTAHIALQTNLPTQEDLKYLNDLQTQKKVNMAIAELCFHLSQSKETEEA